MNPVEKMILQKLGDEVIKKIKSLDPKQFMETMEHLLGEHTELLKKDADHNGKVDLDEALDHFAKGFALLALHDPAQKK